MNNDKLPSKEAAELRRQAEERLLAKKAEFQRSRAEEETQRLVHELEVHQIELEMQNTALRQTRDDLEEALDKYTDLYDFAPVAYFTLDHEGFVHTTNLGGANLLGKERSMLAGQRFGLFVIGEDRPAFAGFLDKVFASEGKESCEVTLLGKGNRPLFVQIEAMAVASRQECRVAAIDITARKQIEAELKQANMQNELILASAGEGIIGMDLKGNHTFVNASAATMLGFEVNELVGKQSHSTWHYARPDGTRYPAEECPIYAAYKDGTVHSGEELFLRKDGTAFPVHFTSRPIIINGEITGAVVTFNDITERKQMEENLRESEGRFRALVTASSQVLYRMSPDWGEMRQLYSQGFLASTEKPSITWLQEYILPDDQPLVTAAIQEAIRTKSIFELEHRVRRGDGSLGWMASRAVPIKDGDGEIVEWFGAANDITRRKQAEVSLRFSEERYRALFRDNPVMIVTLDAELKMLSVNPTCACQLGYQIDELEGRSVLTLFLEDDRPVVVEQLRKCLQTPGQAHRWQFRKVRKDGELLWVEEVAQAVSAFDGTLNILVVCQDITERKRAEEEIKKLNASLSLRAVELEDANRELEAFSYSVAHDLRKPLTVVNGYCQALREQCGSMLDEQCQRYLSEAYDGTWRMNRLIEALLNFSRMAHVELQRETVDLSLVAQMVAAELGQAEASRKVTFRICEGITVDGDPNLLRVILDNLIGNAWKFTAIRDEAEIGFGTAEIDGQSACYVRDNGPGFAMADADKLFLPFQQLTGAEEFRGLGIGLATVERIVRRHGGRVWAEGEPGRGATFYFTLNDARTV